MGKRKTARKPATKKKTVLDKSFACVFCNHENTVTVKLDFDSKIATLQCSACAVNWSTSITVLAEPIDVYSEWIDACQAANAGENARNEVEGGEESDDEEEGF